MAQLGSQPGREVPDDHCRPIHCPRHDPARLHRSRTARPRRVPGRIQRADPRGLRARLAPVHYLVPRPVACLVRRPPRRHRELRPGAGSKGPGPRHRHPAAVHRICVSSMLDFGAEGVRIWVGGAVRMDPGARGRAWPGGRAEARDSRSSRSGRGPLASIASWNSRMFWVPRSSRRYRWPAWYPSAWPGSSTA